MRTFARWLVPVALACASLSPAFAQEMSRLATPHGFRFPYLDPGEYILSAATDYSSSDEDVNYTSMTLTDSRESVSISASGVLAFSRRLLIGLDLHYLPAQDLYTSRQETDAFETEITEHSRGSLVPQVTLVYRPRVPLEFHASVSGQTEKTGLETTPDGMITGPSGTETRRVQFSLGFTYAGRL
jgi:hypothetical protein